MAVVEVAVNVAVNIAAEAAPKELGRLSKLVVIELDKGESKSYNEEAEDYKASYLEA